MSKKSKNKTKKDENLLLSNASKVLKYRKGFELSLFDKASTPGFNGNEKSGEKALAKCGKQLSELQERLFAHGRTAGTKRILLVLQGMDTAGKGGIVRHVVGMVDPQGVRIRNFGKPTDEELSHHYLWRIKNELPKPGYIGVFDRSHYEDVLVVKVHKLVDDEVLIPRYDEINHFEAELADSGTTIIKVAMFVSQEEQKLRLAERLARPDKHWKYSTNDVTERLRWPDYKEAYQTMLEKTSTPHAPWHIIPADNKWFARLAVSQLLLQALEDLDLSWPEPSFDLEKERKRLNRS